MIKKYSNKFQPSSRASEIEIYKPLVRFLGMFLGPRCEVVLHDVSTPENSIVDIINGHLSGRTVGSPLTGLAFRFIKDKVYEQCDFVKEYEGILKDGRKARSTTYFIKSPEGTLRGMLCLNMDVSLWEDFEKRLKEVADAYLNLHARSSQTDDDARHIETFSESIEELMNLSINRALSSCSVPPHRLSPREKVDIVALLYEDGFFQMRGAVECVAGALGISEPTVYRYLKVAKKKSGEAEEALKRISRKG